MGLTRDYLPTGRDYRTFAAEGTAYVIGGVLLAYVAGTLIKTEDQVNQLVALRDDLAAMEAEDSSGRGPAVTFYGLRAEHAGGARFRAVISYRRDLGRPIMCALFPLRLTLAEVVSPSLLHVVDVWRVDSSGWAMAHGETTVDLTARQLRPGTSYLLVQDAVVPQQCMDEVSGSRLVSAPMRVE